MEETAPQPKDDYDDDVCYNMTDLRQIYSLEYVLIIKSITGVRFMDAIFFGIAHVIIPPIATASYG